MDNNGPIGMLDSGLGGLTVLYTACRLLPHEDFIYYADFANSPYGGRTKEALVDIITPIFELLLKRGVKALAFACNTATSATVEHFRSRLPVPVVGLEPALKPAVEMPDEGAVLVLATELTLREEKFSRLYERFRGKREILLLSCPGLVEIIDAGQTGLSTLEQYLSQRFADLPKEAISTVVLGCTHYVLVKEAICKHFPNIRHCLDGNEGVARQIANVIRQLGKVAAPEREGRVELISSSPSLQHFLEVRCRKIFASGN